MRSSAPDPLLVQLSGHRWLVPLLADLASRKGARFVELIHRLGLSRDSLTRTLQAAAALGWVRRNPGHGHPLRPEYILTEAGSAAAARATIIAGAQAAPGLTPGAAIGRSEEHTAELQSLMRITHADFCLKKKKKNKN